MIRFMYLLGTIENFLSGLSGKKTLLAHSIGNVVAAEALRGDGSEKGDHFGSQKIAAGSQKGGHLKA